MDSEAGALYIAAHSRDDVFCPKNGEPLEIKIVATDGGDPYADGFHMESATAFEERYWLDGDKPRYTKADSALSISFESGYLHRDDETSYMAFLKIPKKDGLYKEVVDVGYRTECDDGRCNQKTTRTARTFVAYEVFEGCAFLLDESEYETSDILFEKRPVWENGKIVMRPVRRGFSREEPRREEPLMDRFGLHLKDARHPANDPSWASGEFRGVVDFDFIEQIKDKFGNEWWDHLDELLEALKWYRLCVRVQYTDDYRADIVPDMTTVGGDGTYGMGWQKPRADGALHNFCGIEVEVWDKAVGGSPTDDVFLTSDFVLCDNDQDYYCIDFRWDPKDHGGEMNPDPYIKTKYTVQDGLLTRGYWYTYGPKEGTLTEFAGGYHDYWMDWRDFAALDVGAGETLQKAYVSVDFGPATGDANKKAMGMLPLQRFFETFRSNNMSRDIAITWYSGLGTPRTKGSDDIDFYSESPSLNPWYRRWDVLAHEAGHAFQMQLLGVSSLNVSGCYDSNGGHDVYWVMNDHCSTVEGWAEFVALHSWYLHDYAGLVYYPTFSAGLVEIEPGLEGLYTNDDCLDGSCCSKYPNDLEMCNAHSEMMVARTFWDMYDRNPDGDDLVNDYIVGGNSVMPMIWHDYLPGYGDHEASESTSNLWDYEYNSRNGSYGFGPRVRDSIIHAMNNNYTDYHTP